MVNPLTHRFLSISTLEPWRRLRGSQFLLDRSSGAISDGRLGEMLGMGVVGSFFAGPKVVMSRIFHIWLIVVNSG